MKPELWDEWLAHCGKTEADVKRDNKGVLYIMVECLSPFSDQEYLVPDVYQAYVNEQKNKEE